MPRVYKPKLYPHSISVRAANISPRHMSSDATHRARLAFALFSANAIARPHNQGRIATWHANWTERNVPSSATKPSISGILKSEASEIAFKTPNSTPACFSTIRHGSSFHIHSPSTISLSQSYFLLLAGHRRGTHQNSLARTGIGANSVGRANHHPRLQHIPNPQRTIQRAGKSHRNYAQGMNFLNDRFRRTTRSFGANSAADQSDSAIFKQPIPPSAMFDRPELPASDQRPHLALHGGYDGNSRHIRSPGTTPPTAATRHPPEPSASPVPAPPSPNSQTSSCVPCAPHQS